MAHSQSAGAAQKPCWDEHVSLTQNPPWQSESLAHPLRVQTRVPFGPEHVKSSMSIEGQSESTWQGLAPQ
jgi:hypothetical protein